VENCKNKWFELIDADIPIRLRPKTGPTSASVVMKINNKRKVDAHEGKGPVHAFFCAVKKILLKQYVKIAEVELDDFNLTVKNVKELHGAAMVTVEIEMRYNGSSVLARGTDENLVVAACDAILDGFRKCLDVLYADEY
jgi:hypothetical protein